MRSPKCPNTNDPTGRATNAIPKLAYAASNCADPHECVQLLLKVCAAVADALDHVAGFLVVADLSLGGDGPVLGQHYRPAVRQRARDGFCVLGPRVLPAAALAQPDALSLRIFIDGQLAQATDTARRVRGVAQLIADVTEFMTLRAGDLLLLGASFGAPLAHAGQAVAIDIDGLDGLCFSLVAESAVAAVDDPRGSP